MFWRKVYHIGLLSSLIFHCVFTSREVFSKTHKNSQFIDNRRIVHGSWQTTFAPDYQTSNFSFYEETHPNSTKYLGYLMPHLKYISSYDGSHSFASNHESEDAFYEDKTSKPKNSVSSSSKNAAFGKFSTNRSKSQIRDSGLQTTKISKYEKSKVPLSSSTKKKFYPEMRKPYVMHKYPAKKTVFPNYVRPALQKSKAFPKHKKQSKNPQKPTFISPVFRNQQHVSTKKTNREYLGYLNSFDSTSKNDNGHYEYDEENLTAGKKIRRDSFHETTTRGYYGDRIYMNTLAPQKNLKIFTKNFDFIHKPKNKGRSTY